MSKRLPPDPDQSPRRSRPAHGVKFVDGQSTIIFDTVCTRGRTPWLATPAVHDLFREVMSECTAWLLGRYVLMPDHLHYFAGYAGGDVSFENWARYWKSQFSKRLGRPHCRWQPDHWDVRMRTAEAYEAKWQYVRQNPVRKGLVEHADDWTFQGELFPLRW